MLYKYFVSYRHKDGYGRCEISRDVPISGINDIEGIENAIAKQNGLKGISIHTFQLFDPPAEGDR